MGFDELLQAIYEIQGKSDPNHPPESLQERMNDIFEIASALMKQTGWEPSTPIFFMPRRRLRG